MKDPLATFKTDDGVRTPGETCIVSEMAYQRNGISGSGFYVIQFKRQGTTLQAIVFDEPKHVAIIDPMDLDNHWRGDVFERGLRQVIAELVHEDP